jgi:sporulation-control protein spo0M
LSFFKKIKNRFTSPNAGVTLQLSKNSFALGENIEGTLKATSNEDFDCTEIRLEFQCAEKKKRIVPQYDAAAKREVLREVQDTATLWSAKPTLSGPLHLSPGFSQNYPVSLNIPAGGRPTFHSVDQNVAWSLKGVIAIDGRPDVDSTTLEIQVSPPSASPVIREKEIIHEIVMIPCKYCGALMPQTDTVCPNCGARRTA